MSFLPSVAEPLVKAALFFLMWAALAAPFLLAAALLIRGMRRRATLTLQRISVMAIVLSFLVAPVPTPMITFFYPSGYMLLDLRYWAEPWIDGRPIFSAAWHAGSVATTAVLLLIAAFIHWRHVQAVSITRRAEIAAASHDGNKGGPKRSYLLPVALLVVAVAIYGWAVEQRSVAGPPGFSMPMPPGTGTHRSPAFRVHAPTSHDIVIETDRRLPVQRLDCLLGIGFDAATRCLEIGPVVSVAWQVMENGGTMVSGHSEDFRRGAWGAKVSRKIGAFTGRPGIDYVVEWRSSKDTSALAGANPRIAVRPDPAVTKGRIARAALVGMSALILAAIAVGWLIGLAVRATWRSLFPVARDAHPGE
jgi:hypothetical protein